MNAVSRYTSYLVRLWCQAGDGKATNETVWRAAVESIQSGETWLFDDPGALAAFFAARLQKDDGDTGGGGEQPAS